MTWPAFAIGIVIGVVWMAACEEEAASRVRPFQACAFPKVPDICPFRIISWLDVSK